MYEIYDPGGGASDTTVLRDLDELAERLRGNGLPGRRLSRAMARARAKAWAASIDRHGGLPAVRIAGADLRRPGENGQPGPAVMVVRLDATVIQAASDKDGAEPNFQGYGFHPLTAWCSNVGDCQAAMLRPGSAGSFTAADQTAVVDAAIAQLPPQHRTRAAIDAVREADWASRLTADAKADDKAQVVELTGLLRHSVGGDHLAGWPQDLSVIARRRGRIVAEFFDVGCSCTWLACSSPTGCRSGCPNSTAPSTWPTPPTRR